MIPKTLYNFIKFGDQILFKTTTKYEASNWISNVIMINGIQFSMNKGSLTYYKTELKNKLSLLSHYQPIHNNMKLSEEIICSNILRRHKYNVKPNSLNQIQLKYLKTLKKDENDSNVENSTPSSFSLDELPDTVYVPLGRRGMDSIALKMCPDCNHKRLILIHKDIRQEVLNEGDPPARKEIVDYKVRCRKCDCLFIIRLNRIFFKDKLIQTLVSIIPPNDESELWLGNIFW